MEIRAQWTSRGQCSRGDSCSFKHDLNKQGKRKRRRSRSFLSMKRGGTRKVTEKVMPKEEGPKVPVRSGKSNKRVCHHFQDGQCQKESACEYWHSPECSHYRCKGGCNWRAKRVFEHTSKAVDDKSGNATIAINFEEAKEMNGVMQDGQGTTFEPQSTLKNIGWPPTEKQVGVRYLSHCGRTLPYKSKKTTIGGYCSVGIRKRSRSERPYLWVICGNSGLNIVKTNHEL